jgi:peroxiredoxin Q/BCP
MKLSIAQTAPDFTLIDIFNREIKLESYRRKRLFIGFFRHAGCPFCNLRVHALTKVHKELQEKGMEMIFFFESKKEVMLRSMFHKEVSPIPLIADPEKKMYAAYGLEESRSIAIKSHLSTFVQTVFKASRAGVPIHLMASGESFNTIPAEFLIDYDLSIKKVHYAQGLNDRLSMDLVKHFAEVGETELPPIS